MSEEVVGYCFVCNNIVFRSMLGTKDGQSHPEAYYYAGWPRDGLACAKHHGVIEEYERELAQHQKSALRFMETYLDDQEEKKEKEEA